MKQKPNITQNELSERIGITIRAIANITKKLKDEGIIERIGSDKKGEWKILKGYR